MSNPSIEICGFIEVKKKILLDQTNDFKFQIWVLWSWIFCQLVMLNAGTWHHFVCCNKNIIVDLAKQERVKKLNKEIKEFYHEKKKSTVRRNIHPGSSASLWKAVKKANDVDIKELPNTLFILICPRRGLNSDLWDRYSFNV